MFDRKGKPILWDERFIPRRKAPVPCECTPPGPCLKKDCGLEEFSKKNDRVFQRYLEAMSVGPLPQEATDPLFRENCAALRRVEKDCDMVLMNWAMWGRPNGSN